MENKNRHQVICFGEVLWDILPTGTVPGGAPMNVNYHLEKLGKNPALITRIGLDDMGRELVDIFSAKGVCTEYFQLDYAHETGKVYGRLKDAHEMVYEIVEPVAWDFIQWENAFSQLVSDADYFVFGSLAARSKVSRETLFTLMQHAKTKVLDINLRAPHYNRDIVEALLQKADIVKMNEAELELITGWFSPYKTDEERMEKVQELFSISKMVVTRGEKGAIVNWNGTFYQQPGIQVDVADTVGSGDSFLAGFLAQIMEGANPQEALQFACVLGAFIATQKGGCPDYNLEQVKDLMQSVRVNA
jgi:fructokinase